MQDALSRPVEPTEAERAVARIASVPDLSEGREDLVAALTSVFAQGSLSSAESLTARRTTLIGDLCGLRARLERGAAQSRIVDIYRSFTHREIDAIGRPETAWPETLPPVSDEQRQALVLGLKKLMEPLGEGYGVFYPWKEAARRLDHSLHPGRGRSRSRGLSL